MDFLSLSGGGTVAVIRKPATSFLIWGPKGLDRVYRFHVADGLLSWSGCVSRTTLDLG